MKPLRPTRRQVLGGAAVAIGLPFLESIARPKRAVAQSARPLRFLGWHVANGVWRSSWTPTAEGPNYALTPTLTPLSRIKSKVLVLSGIQNNDGAEVLGAHCLGVSGMLTCVTGSLDKVSVGISIDQVYANSLGTATRLPSLQLGITDSMVIERNYPAIYNGCVSWASATQPLQPVVQPNLIFDQLFAGSDSDASALERQKRLALRKSVLDHVLDEAQTLDARLGATDKRKLDEYMTTIRGVERQLESAATNRCTPGDMVKPPPAPLPARLDWPTQTKIMSDLMVIALSCDATRVITFMQSNGGRSSYPRCPWLGITEDHHVLAHHQNDPAKGAKLAQIERWEVEQFAAFIERLEAIDDVDGSLLDNSIVFFSSEIGDGDAHDQVDKPILVAGNAGGKLLTGRHLRFANEPSQADLFMTFLNALDCPVTSFGTAGRAPLAGLDT